MAHPSTRQDLYTRVTTRILAELEKGVRPWIKPWSVVRAATKKTSTSSEGEGFFLLTTSRRAAPNINDLRISGCPMKLHWTAIGHFPHHPPYQLQEFRSPAIKISSNT